MELENLLTQLGEKIGKSPTYLKGLYNTSKKVYDEQFGDSLTDDQKVHMALTKIGKKYGMEDNDIDIMISDKSDSDDEPIDFPIADFITELPAETPKGFTTTDDPNHGQSGSAWGRFLSTIPDPTKPSVEYEKTPSLLIELGPTYYLKLTDPADIPYSHEFEGKHGRYTKHAFKVTLIKVSDEALYSELYTKGEFAGQKAYIDGRNYTLWLDDKSVGYFRIFWEKITDDGMPDGRVFTYKYGKKANYNVFTYGLPKKKV